MSGLSNVNTYKTLKNMTSITRGLGAIVADSLTVSNVTADLLNTPQVDDNVFSNITITDSIINSTVIGNTSPFEATFRNLTVGQDGRGYNVTFYSDQLGTFLYWDGSLGTLFLNGTLDVTNIALGNLQVEGNSIFPKSNDGGIELAVGGQQSINNVIEDTISFLGPVYQHTTVGNVEFNVCNSTGQILLDSANTIWTRSMRDTNIKTYYGDINLETGIMLELDITNSSIAVDNYVVLSVTSEMCPDNAALIFNVGDSITISGASSSILNTTTSTFSIIGIVSDTSVKINLLANTSNLQAQILTNIGGTIRRTNISNNNIFLKPSGYVQIPLDKSFYFGPESRIFSTSNDFNVVAGSGKMVLTANTVALDNNAQMIWNSSSFIQASTNYLNIRSTGTSMYTSDDAITIGSDKSSITINSDTFVKFKNLKPVYFGDHAFIQHTDTQFIIEDVVHEILLNTNLLKCRQNMRIQLDVAESYIERRHLTDEVVIRNQNHATLSKIIIDAPTTYISGNLEIGGVSTIVNSTVTTISDPVISLGVNTTTGDSMDRGIKFLYSNVGTRGFFGWRNVNRRFSFIPEVTSSLNEIYSGNLGDIECRKIFTESVESYDGSNLKINGSGTLDITNFNSIKVPTDSRVYLNTTTYLTANNLNQVTLNSSDYLYLTSGHIKLPDDAFIKAVNGEVEIQNSLAVDRIRMNDVIIESYQDEIEITNLSILDFPNNCLLRWSDGSYIKSQNDTLYISSEVDIRMNAPITQGSYQASIIDLQYGGSGKGIWGSNNVVFINSAGDRMTESSNFQYSSLDNELKVNSLLFTTNSINSSNGVINLTPLRVDQTAIKVYSKDFEVDGNLWVFDNIYLNASGNKKIYSDKLNDNLVLNTTGYFDFKNENGIINSNDSKIVINNDLKLLYGKKMFFGADGNSIIVPNSSGNNLQISSISNILLRPGGVVNIEPNIKIQLGSVEISGSSNTHVLTVDRHLSLTENDSTIFFTGSTFIKNLGNTGEIQLSTKKLIVDGDLEVLGKVQNSIIQTAIIDSNFIKVGQGKYANLVSVFWNGSSSSLTIVFAEPHSNLNIGDEVQILDTKFTPNIDGQYLISNVVNTTTIQIQISNFSGFDEEDLGNGKIRLPLNSENSRDVGLELKYYNSGSPWKGFLFFKDSSSRFVLANKGVNNSDVITVSEKGHLELGTLHTDFISGATFQGAVDFGDNLLTSSNVKISGGSIDNFTTTTLSQVNNLNANYLQGYLANNFVFRDGSLALTSNWDAGSFYIEANTFIGKTFNNTSVVFVDEATKALKTNSTFVFNNSTSTLACNLDVSERNITFRNEQIDGTKLTGFAATLSIGGNSATVTNGVYTTNYNPNTILKSDLDNNPEPLEINENSIVGRAPGETISALTPLKIRQIADVPQVGFIPSEESSFFTGTSNNVIGITFPLSFIEVVDNTPSASTAVATLSNGDANGRYKIIVACNTPGTELQVQAVILSAEGIKATKTLVFENAGQSVHLVWFHKIGAWYIVNSGCVII